MATALPTLSSFLVKNFVINPYLDAKRRNQLKEFITEQKFLIAKKKEETLMVHELLRPFYERRVEIEKNQNGLVILSAIYCAKESKESLNVIVPLQMLVTDSQLIQRSSSKSELLGFYDLALGMEKQLTIKYQFRLAEHQVTIGDTCELIIPQRKHLIQSSK